MLGKNREPLQKIYLNVARGRVERTFEGGRKEYYNYIEGHLEQISTKERTFKGAKVKYWYLDIRDGEELYSLGFPVYSGVLRSIVLSLASAESLSRDTPVRLEFYEKNGYTKVSSYAAGVGLDWVTKELPPIRATRIGGRTVTDETERNEYIENLIRTIQERIG